MSVVADFLRGMAIGLANIIPGVSGGTMALILGIYERLIRAIHNIGPQTLKALFGGRQALAVELRRIDARFLATLTSGAIVAIVAVAELMVHLLEHQHDPTYGFFFGLVLVSVVFPYKLIRRKGLGTVVSCVLAVGLVVALSSAVSPQERLASAKKKAAIKTNRAAVQVAQGAFAAPATPADATGLTVFFLAGAVAISAMILPGISGSFVLLLLGVYFDVLSAINELRRFGEGWLGDAALLSALALGCLVGLLLFSRLLNFLLERYHDLTMAFLLGLVIGSLYAIWPFKHFADVAGKRIDLAHRLPTGFGSNELCTLLAFLVGAAIVGAFIWAESRLAVRQQSG